MLEHNEAFEAIRRDFHGKDYVACAGHAHRSEQSQSAQSYLTELIECMPKGDERSRAIQGLRCFKLQEKRQWTKIMRVGFKEYGPAGNWPKSVWKLIPGYARSLAGTCLIKGICKKIKEPKGWTVWANYGRYEVPHIQIRAPERAFSIFIWPIWHGTAKIYSNPTAAYLNSANLLDAQKEFIQNIDAALDGHMAEIVDGMETTNYCEQGIMRSHECMSIISRFLS